MLILSPVFRLWHFIQRAERLDLSYYDIVRSLASGKSALYRQEWRLEFMLMTVIYLREYHEWNMAELVFKGNEDDLTLRPLATYHESGYRYLRSITKSRNVLAAKHIAIETGAQMGHDVPRRE